jgi:GT2 family glycosyltransferase
VVKATNRGAAESRGDILLFVDDDVFVPASDLLRNHARNFEDKTIHAVVGRERQIGDPVPALDVSRAPSTGFLTYPGGQSPLQQALSFNRNGDAAQRVCTFCTCNGSIRRSAFLAVGGFDELFAANSYGYDYDLALRLTAAKFSLVYDPDAWLIHRRVALGGMRLTDRANKASAIATFRGLWLFVLRHGHRGMYGNLVFHHVLRKTLLLKQNIVRPWRQPILAIQAMIGFARASAIVSRGPQSRFSHNG